MKTFVLTVSRVFPKTHKRSGESTFFIEKIKAAIEGTTILNFSKRHTIRANYDLWKKRINQVNEGKAVLSLRYWTGSPYNYKRDGSKQKEFLQLKKGECSVQEIDYSNFVFAPIDGKIFNWEDIAKNDGLSFEDFCEWFKDYDSHKTMAIIHFTEFRYK